MTNREWLMNQSKEQTITNMSKPCQDHQFLFIVPVPNVRMDFSCTECWIDWLNEQHKESNEPEN